LVPWARGEQQPGWPGREFSALLTPLFALLSAAGRSVWRFSSGRVKEVLVEIFAVGTTTTRDGGILSLAADNGPR